jgi:hypothetical protein
MGGRWPATLIGPDRRLQDGTPPLTSTQQVR